jgi:hypothetical protein
MTSPPSFRSIALPVEHGGWGFTLEPVLLGLLVAPGVSGALLGVVAFGLFLAYRPVRLVLADVRRRRRLPRTRMAALVAGGYLAAGTAALGAALLTASEPFWWVLLLTTPLVALQFWFDARGKTRALLRELSGAIAAGAFASAIGLAGGWETGPALALWAVLALRTIVSVVLVRAQIRRAHAEPYRVEPIALVHAAAFGVAIALAGGGLLSLLGASSIGLLGAWAVVALRLRPVAARTVGFNQMGLGLLVVALAAIGHHTGW